MHGMLRASDWEKVPGAADSGAVCIAEKSRAPSAEKVCTRFSRESRLQTKAILAHTPMSALVAM
jgi:hypothetical protein